MLARIYRTLMSQAQAISYLSNHTSAEMSSSIPLKRARDSTPKTRQPSVVFNNFRVLRSTSPNVLSCPSATQTIAPYGSVSNLILVVQEEAYVCEARQSWT